MNLKDIQEIASSNEVYLRGTEYFIENRVKDLDWYDDGRYVAEVQGSRDIWRVVVDIGLHDSIGYYSCSCPAFRKFYGACKHIVAVLMEIRDLKIEDLEVKLEEEEEIFAEIWAEMDTQRRLEQVYDLMELSITEERHRLEEQQEQTPPALKLVPTIIYDHDHSPFLSLTVGTNRQYVIKNISEFCWQMVSGTPVIYGKQPPIVHRIQDFEPQSAELARLILQKEREFRMWVHQQNFKLRRYSAELKEEVGRELLLTPAMLDTLFDIWQDREILLELSGRKKRKLLVTQEPAFKITLRLAPGEKEGEVCLRAAEEQILRGEKFCYLADEKHLFRIDPAYTAQGFRLAALLQLINSKPEGLILEERVMRELDANVLQTLEPLMTLQAEEDLQARFLSQPLKKQLYIEKRKDGSVAARLYFVYGEELLEAFDENRQSVFSGRSYAQEEQAQLLVLKYFPHMDLRRREAFIPAEDEEAFYVLLEEGLMVLSGVMTVYASEDFQRIRIQSLPPVQAAIRLESDWLDLSLDTQGIPLAEWADIIQAYQLRKKYFRLQNGNFIRLEGDAVETVSSLLEGLDIRQLHEPQIRMPRYRALFLEQLLREHPDVQCDREESFEQMVRRIERIAEREWVIPEGLQDVLRDYQKTGFCWLMTMKQYGFGGILADDMGLGKTLQVITMLLYEKLHADSPKHTLITCPASLIYNWQAEVRKFAPELTTLTVVGNLAERKEKIGRSLQYDIIITSYDLLRRDIELYQEQTFDIHILDEAQYIKNQNTHSARSVRKIRSSQRFALTGTPIENNIAELWSIFDFLMPGYLGSYSGFRERFEKPIIKQGDEKALRRLTQLTSPFILRRMKREVLQELPEKNEIVIPAEMEPEQRKLYQANLLLLRQDFQKQLQEKGLASSKIVLLSLLMRLRQLCCHPLLCYEDYRGGSGKLELCMEIIRSSVASGHKILLFSQFTSMLDILSEKLKKEKLEHYYLKGATPKEARARMVEAFQKATAPLFLISLKAGGTGLNLTAADIVIHYDPWWNLSVQNQATDRAHRIGQNSSVQVYQLITRDSIEEKILHLQQRKQELADSVIGAQGSIISSMSAEEILALFDE